MAPTSTRKRGPHRPWLLPAVAAWTIACAPEPPRSPVGAQPTPPAAVVSAPKAAPPAAPATPPPAPVAFSTALEIDQTALHAYAAGSIAVVVAGRFDGEKTYVLDATGLREDPRLRAGIEGLPEHPQTFSLGSVWGDFPAMYASVNLPGDRGGDWIDYQWAGDRWKKRPASEQAHGGWSPEYSSAYYLGGFLAFGPDGLHQRMHYADGTDTWKPVMGWMKARDRRPLPVLAPAAAADRKLCTTRARRHYDFAATPDGGLVGVGVACGADAGMMVLERWAPGWKRSTVQIVPGTANHYGALEGMIGVGSPRIFVRGATTLVFAAIQAPPGTPESERSTEIGSGQPLAPHVVRIEGERADVISPPGGRGPIRDLDVAPDGSFAFLDDDRYHARPVGASAWTSIAPPATPSSMARAPDGSHWVILAGGEVVRRAPNAAAFEVRGFPRRDDTLVMRATRFQWLSSGEALVETELWQGKAAVGAALLREKREGVTPREETVSRPSIRVGTTRPITGGCTEPLAVLFAMTKVAPDDYDFPVTRKALKGKLRFRGTELFVGRDGGRRYLVARPPSVAVGRDLVAVIEKEVAGSKPQLVCGSPAEVVRPFKLDLGTGELVK